MATLMSRRETFPSPPEDEVAWKLAEAGFYKIGDDKLKCWRCGLEVTGVTNSDDPLKLHEGRQADCSFAEHYQIFRRLFAAGAGMGQF